MYRYYPACCKDWYDNVRLSGRKLLALALLKEYGIYLNKETFIHNPWGKPELAEYPDIGFNISYCNGCIACVVSRYCQVGIDVEKVRQYNRYAAMHVCHESELAAIDSSIHPERDFFRLWTLKESYIKALGMGLSFPMREVLFNIDQKGRVKSQMDDCAFFIWEDNFGYITSVCYKYQHIERGRINGKLY